MKRLSAKRRSFLAVFPALSLTAAVLLTLTSAQVFGQTSAGGFSDVDAKNPHYTAIMYLKSRGILNGYEDGTFRPGDLVKRIEAVKVLVPADGDLAQISFQDTLEGQWYTPFLKRAVTLGISGYADGTFRPTATVNRAEILKMLFVLHRVDSSQIGNFIDIYAGVPGNAWFSSYFRAAKYLQLYDVPSGQTLDAAAKVTRAELAEILYRFLIHGGPGSSMSGPNSVQKQSSAQSGSSVVQIPADVPDCSAQTVFSVLPLDASAYDYIAPLGNVNPPDHTVPADHVYFVLKRNSAAPFTSSGAPATFAAAVKSPGDIYVTSITGTTWSKNGVVNNSDYSLEFALCKNVTGKFGHLSELSPELLALVADNKWDGCNQITSGKDAQLANQCSKRSLDYKLKAGASVGTAGGKSSNALDLGLNDSRIAKPAYANSARFNSFTFTAVCPVDYFRADLQPKLTAALGDLGKPRTRAPVCGEIAQDKAGTLKGIWFAGDGMDSPQVWSSEMSFVAYNKDPDKSILAAGGKITAVGTYWLFTPAHSGIVNRDFSEVTPGNTIYCYQNDGADGSVQVVGGGAVGGVSGAGSVGLSAKGHVLVQLVTATQLKAENMAGACASGGGEKFSQPVTYNR